MDSIVDTSAKPPIHPSKQFESSIHSNNADFKSNSKKPSHTNTVLLENAKANLEINENEINSFHDDIINKNSPSKDSWEESK